MGGPCSGRYTGPDVIGRSLAALLLLLAVAGAVATRSSAAGAEGLRLQEVEAAIFAELNAVRMEKGLRSLAPSPGLQAAARAHSRAMLATGRFRHESANGTSFSERIRRFYPSQGFLWWTVGENLIYQTDDVQAGDAIAAWLGSPPHRRNLLSTSWREICIGAARSLAGPGDFRGEPVAVVTVDFGSRNRATSAR